jgi:hypothetical protein
LFGAHTQNLQLYSGEFPSDMSSETGHHVIKVDEDRTVLALLLQYMHRCVQPDPKAIPFNVLEQLANAAEKYIVYSAMVVCKLRME